MSLKVYGIEAEYLPAYFTKYDPVDSTERVFLTTNLWDVLSNHFRDEQVTLETQDGNMVLLGNDTKEHYTEPLEICPPEGKEMQSKLSQEGYIPNRASKSPAVRVFTEELATLPDTEKITLNFKDGVLWATVVINTGVYTRPINIAETKNEADTTIVLPAEPFLNCLRHIPEVAWLYLDEQAGVLVSASDYSRLTYVIGTLHDYTADVSPQEEGSEEGSKSKEEE